MAKKETKDVKQGTPGFNDPNEKTYRARLKVGDKEVATITLRAKDDEDAKEQLERSKPSYYEGLGDWVLTKVETVEVK